MNEKMKLLLSGEDINKGISKGLEKYKDLNFWERFAMFMGIAQIVEFGLKQLLEEKFNYDLKIIEKWTLGKTTQELENNNLRKDFIKLLKSVVDNRNYIAHELLINKALFKGILGSKIPTGYYDKESRFLNKAIYELEQLLFIFDWTNSNNAWH
ncbi:MAG: hypothetical protein JXB19_09405 [Bacteroidales bacterium]|nr:hypothetical protein [Bacteroidales bacterium]